MDYSAIAAQTEQDLAFLEEQLVKRAFFARLSELGHNPSTPEAAEAAWEVGLYLQQLPDMPEGTEKQAEVDPYELGASQLVGLLQDTPVAQAQAAGHVKAAAEAAQAIPGVSDALKRVALAEVLALQQLLGSASQG